MSTTNRDARDHDARRDEQIRAASDHDLALAYDNGLADFALAERYDHNAHLRPAIRARLDAISAEQKRRADDAREKLDPFVGLMADHDARRDATPDVLSKQSDREDK